MRLNNRVRIIMEQPRRPHRGVKVVPLGLELGLPGTPSSTTGPTFSASASAVVTDPTYARRNSLSPPGNWVNPVSSTSHRLQPV